MTPKQIRHVIIRGGPAPADIAITDSETGEDLSSLFHSFEVTCDSRTLVGVQLRAYAEVDLKGEYGE